MGKRKAHKRLHNWQKASALVPLALLSGAWTASIAVPSATAADPQPGNLPDGTQIPTRAIKAPASVTMPGEIAPGVPSGSAHSVIASASTNGIPAAALSAYQRAAQVINAADPSCHMGWQLIAAIGRVESDHGRYGGNTLTTKGISTPGIYGIPLDGRNGTARVADTDGGQYDNDPIYDRAVGPMQFIPSTWSVVGVDADGDGQRNPQDINDAALATAVYLCSGNEDLSTPAGQRAAVYRYNHSQDYVNLVLSIMKAYTAGDYSSVPTSAASSTTFSPSSGGTSSAPGAPRHPHQARGHHAAGTSHGGSSAGTGGGSSSGGSGSGSGGSTPSSPSSPSPSSSPTSSATKAAKKATKPVVDTLAAGQESVNFCAAQLQGITDNQDVINKCAAKVAGMTKSQAAAAIPDTLAGVAAWLGMTVADITGGVTGGGGLLGG
ncbi:MAG: lytic transglycosylase domain-containing protein [Nocardioidaceae bacterium]